ncbi:B-cell receptor CD22-like, partial [Anguilla rostrata]|uniref:B-cell receptor CD22-like n=1 Tax=Anguilla rostrata TaxID=7938 RepID=UPI0030CF8D94
LQVKVTENEAQSVKLTCSSTCTLSGSPTLTWYKNGTVVPYEKKYSLNLASTDDTDLYSCATGGVTSPAVNVKCVKVEINSDTVSGGDSVELTCTATCTHLTESNSFIWYKNEQLLTGDYRFSQSDRNLTFTARSEDTGRYSCAVEGYQHLVSPAVTLSVRCVKVDINSDTVSGGETVGLTCTATCTHLTESNSFIWYKNEQLLTDYYRFSQSYGNLKFTARSEDTGRYSCAVRGNQHLVSRAVTLSVRCLKVEMKSSTVSERVRVTLTCNITCTDLTANQTFIWYKNGQFLQNTTRNMKIITTFSSKPAVEMQAAISCAVRGHENLPSPAVTLSVRYPPNNTLVSVSSSGEIVEGSSVTLTCSSDANPPVQNYTWYKKNDTGVWQAGSGQSLNFSNFRSWNRGQYYCEAQNRLGAQNSSAILVTVQGGQSLIMAAAVGVAEMLALVFLCVCLRRRKSTNETEGDRQGNKSPIDGNFSEMAMSHTGTQGHQPHP